MNIVLDWLVDNHKAASKKAWKQSTMVHDDLGLNFQSGRLTIKFFELTGLYIYHCRVINFVDHFSKAFVTKRKRGFDFNLLKRGTDDWNPHDSFHIQAKSLFEYTFELKTVRPVQTFPIHLDQVTVIKAFLNIK